MASCHCLVQLLLGLMLVTVSLAGPPPSYVHHKVSMDDAKAQLAPHQRKLKRGDNVEPAVLSDIKFIKCQVCKQLVTQALRQIDAERRFLKSYEVLHEEVILEKLENVCDADGDGGEWIRRFDIVEDGDRLLLNDTGKIGDTCNTECRTIERSCNDLLDTHIDQNAVSETVFKKAKTNDEILAWLCSEETVCKPPPPVPADRKPGPVHSTTKAALKKQMREERKAKKAAKKAAKAAEKASGDDTAVEVKQDEEKKEDEEPRVVKLDIENKDLDPLEVKRQLLEQGFVENAPPPSHEEL